MIFSKSKSSHADLSDEKSAAGQGERRVKGEKKLTASQVAFLFSLTYMVSYITRINYGAILAEMESALGISKSLLSMAVTGSFIAYGTGQIVSGIGGDRFSPKRLVTAGLSASVLMNLALPFCKSPYSMLAVWCMNGFAQAFLWPPLVKLMTVLLDEESYKKASVKVSWGSSFGTVAVYLISPLIISTLSWKWVFWFSAACGAVMTAIWIRSVPSMGSRAAEKVERAERAEKPQKTKGDSLGKAARRGLFLSPLMLSVMFAIILQGMLRDGVTTWTPTYILETYHLSSSVSILTGVVLPIFSILSFQLASVLYRKKLTNPMICAGVFFVGGALSAAALFLLTGKGVFSSVLFCALLTGCMHGVNLILICMLPSYFKKYGRVSTVSGVLNTCTYIGSALSTYGIALLSERFPWRYTLFLWMLVSLVGGVVMFCSSRPWKKRFDVSPEEPGVSESADILQTE